MMPEKLNNWEGLPAPIGFSWKESIDETGHLVHEIQSGPFARKMVQTLVEIVLTMARMDHYIIIDDVSFGKCQVDIWKDALKDYKVIWIGLKAPLDILEAREKERFQILTHGDLIIQSMPILFSIKESKSLVTLTSNFGQNIEQRCESLSLMKSTGSTDWEANSYNFASNG